MEIYHLFSTENGTKYRGWCSRYILPLCVQEEGLMWSGVCKESPYRLAGKGWEAVKAGHLTSDEKSLCGEGRHWQRHGNNKQQQTAIKLQENEKDKTGN